MKKILLVIWSFVIILNLMACHQTSTLEVVKCLYCGEKNLTDSKFCAYCGKSFLQSDGETAPDGSSGFGKDETENEECTNGEGETPVLPDSETTADSSSGSDKDETDNEVSTNGEDETLMLPDSETAADSSSGPDKDETDNEESTNGEGEPLPPEDLYVMQNSGANSVYYGSNICIDGDMIYLGYYGNLYVFCGNEVATYAGGGKTMSSMAEIYLYNGYVYYANQSNHCIYRMSVADGKREVVLSDIGDIQNTFMLKNILFVESDVTDSSYNVIYTLNLDTLKNKELIRDDRPYQLIQIDNDHQLLMSDTDGKTLRLLRMNAIDGKAEELWSMNVLESIFYVTPKTEGPYIYFRISGFDESGEDVSVYYKFNQENYIAERSTRDEYNNISNGPNDDYEWQYYLAWGSNNLCREHKETGVQELLLRSGSGQREEGETVAKTYAINEIIYADDTRIIFTRSRMADGLEWSVWMVDSDGNNLIELIRKEYHANEPEPYPTGAPSASGGSSGSSGSSSDDPAVGTKTCALCEGDGRVTCYYCKGSGKGPTIYVMGIPTEQGCTYCGSAGWRLCSGCGGRGQK